MPVMRSVVARILVTGLCVGAMVACLDVPTAPPLPYGIVTFTPPAYYSLWWSMDETCSAVSGSLASVTFYSVPDSVLIVGANGAQADGYYTTRGNEIVLHARLINNGAAVRHEMLHALIQAGHLRSQFLERCGGVVACSGSCITDAGPPPVPPPETPAVPPDSFDVAVEFTSSTVSPSVNGGYLGITVTAHNRATHAVIAAVPLSGGTLAFRATFEIQLDRPDGSGSGLGHVVQDSEELFFAAGETKRLVFDFAPSHPVLAVAGTYTVTGRFGGHAAAPKLLIVTP